MSVFSDFEPRALTFMPANASALAHAADAAYPCQVRDASGDRVETHDEWLSRVSGFAEIWGFERIEFFDAQGCQAYMMGRDDAIVMSFRGTEMKIEDIMTDLRIRKIGGPLGGRIHRGFLLSLLAIWDDYETIQGTKYRGMEHVLRDMKGDRAPAIWLTGHSLGAALATLAAAFLVEEGQPVQGLYSFGCPRVGDSAFVTALNSRCPRNYRLVNNNDVVTRVPPRSFGYDHTGEFWYLSEGGALSRDPNSWYLFLDMALGRLCDLGEVGTDGIKDHAMNNGPDGYIPALKKALG